MKINLPEQIHEFYSALRCSYSYDFRKNIYIWFGILWGLPIPIVTILLETHFFDSVDITQSIHAALQSPVQWIFLIHPLIFGALFGILGTIRHEKDKELASKIQQLNILTIHDPLTGLKNRRHFVNIFHDECARSLRRKERLSLLFLDIDFFKKINDNHGHYFGDVVLQELGFFLKSECRAYDTPVRWGGEEFLILLPATDEKAAILYAERIRRRIESGCSKAITIPITISIGLTEHYPNDTMEQMTDRADQALYHAKQTGRNRVISWSEYHRFRRKANGH